MIGEPRARSTALPIGLAVLAAIAVLAIGVAPAAAGDGATILYVEPDEPTADPGETVTVDVKLSDDGDLYGTGVTEIDLTIAYDSDVLALTDAEHDPWLPEGEADADASVERDDDAGELSIREVREPPGNGTMGTGTMATLTFAVAEDAEPTDADVVFAEASIDGVDWPRTVVDRNATVLVDGGAEGGSADDTADPVPGPGLAVAIATLAIVASGLLALARLDARARR